MKKAIVVFTLITVLFSCNNDKKEKIKAPKIDVSFEIERFDKAYYETKPEQFQALKQKYYYFFPPQMPDSLWFYKVKHPDYRELYGEVQKQFPDNKFLKSELKKLYGQIAYHLPKQSLPKRVNTLISEMDYESKAIFTDSLLIISLDMYLGKNHKFYEFPEYLKQTFEPKQIAQDLVSDLYARKGKIPTDKSFLAQMVYNGKQLYLKDVLTPDADDATKMGYTPEQIKWCKENEAEIWRYFVERNMLYDTDANLLRRFILPSPFSKFYLDLDNESPGRIGVWMGWQMVKSYMKNNDVSLQQLLDMDEKELFLQSKYKPKK